MLMECSFESASKALDTILKNSRLTSHKAEVQALLAKVHDTKLKNELEHSLRAFEQDADYSTFEKIEQKINNDYGQMKNLYDLVGQLDTSEVDVTHKKHLDEVLSTFVDDHSQFLNEMDIYLSQKTDANFGEVRLDNKEMYLGLGQNPGYMSMSEIFVHEILHAATGYALETNQKEASQTLGRINKLYIAAQKNIKVEDILDPQLDENFADTYKRAEDTYNYIFNNKNGKGLHEFIAYGMTNSKVMEALARIEVYPEKDTTKGTFLDQLIAYIKNMFNLTISKLRTEQGIKADKLLMKLSLGLAKANNKAMTHANKNIIDKMWDKTDLINAHIKAVVTPLLKKFEKEKLPPIGEGTFAVTKWWLTNFPTIMASPKLRTEYFNVLSELGLKPWGTLQSLMRTLFDKDEFDRSIEHAVSAANQIDRFKNNEEHTVRNIIREGFKTEVSRNEYKALGKMLLETDLSSLSEDYTTVELAELIKDPKYLDDQIKVFEDALTGKYKNFYRNQAEGLGKYMATGTAPFGQHMNALNINNRVGTSTKFQDVILDNEATIDKLASLYSIKYMPKVAKEVASTVVDREIKVDAKDNGIFHTIAMHKAFKAESKKQLGLESKDARVSNELKGYTREIYSNEVDVQIAPVSSQKELEEQGYKLVKVLPKDYDDRSTIVRGFFISEDPVLQRYDAGGIRIIDQKSKGTTITKAHWMDDGDIKSSKDNIKIYQRRLKRESSLNNKSKINIEKSFNGLIPVFDHNGNATDFRYQMSKADKAQYLGRDSSLDLMLSHMHGSLIDKVQSKKKNKELINMLIQDSSNQTSNEIYVRIGAEPQTDKERRALGELNNDPDLYEAWKLMPREIKSYIKEKTGNEFIMVRGNLKDMVFGHRRYSIGSSRVLNKIPMAAHMVRKVEHVWQDLIKQYKVDIVIKTPAVLIMNILSNFSQGVLMGVSPTDMFKLKIEGFERLNEYKQHEFEHLKLLKRKEAGLPINENQIRILQETMNRNPIKPLIDAGMYQAIVEDVEIEEEIRQGNVILTQLEDVMQRAPKWVRTGADWLYMTPRSPIFKVLLKSTQYSDLVARYATYHGLREKYVRQGMSQESADKQALDYSIDAFINYELPDSRLVNYLNKMGLVMFTKYFTRIQNVLKRTIKDNPINVAGLMGMETMLNIDIETPFDASFIEKSYSNMFHWNPVYDAMTELAQPSLIQVGDKYLWGR